MHLLQLESPNVGGQGDHVYRTRQPCRALGELPGVSVVSGSWLAPETHRLARSADVLVLCDVVEADLLPLLEDRRRRGLPTVYEINDHFRAPQPWNPTAYLATNLLSRSLSAQLAARSDANQLTTPELVSALGPLNPRRLVAPNQLWEVAPWVDRPDGETVWLGWGGSLGHLEDLTWVMPVLRRALERHPRAGLAVMGAEDFRPLLQWVPPGRLRFVPAGSIEAYYRFLDTLDVAICPLLPTPFNRCRSDVKFLELAAHRVAAICSDLAPYRTTIRNGETGLLFGTLEELEAGLGLLLGDRSRRLDLARAAHAHVSEARQERAHAPERLRFYAQLLAGRGPGPAGGWLPVDRPPPPFEGSQYQALTGGEVGALLYRGLRLARDGHRGEAARVHAQAARLAPAQFLPHLYQGTAEPDPRRAIAALRRALECAPESPSVALVLASRLEEAGERAQAQRQLERCRALAPTLGAAEAQLAALAEQEGQPQLAASLYEAAFAANPYLTVAPMRLALATLAAGDAPRATAILERAIAHDQDLWTLHFLLGRAHLEAGQLVPAREHLERALPTAADPAPVLAQLAKVHLGLGDLARARAVLEQLRPAPPVTGTSRG